MGGENPEARTGRPAASAFHTFEGKTASGSSGCPATRWTSASQYERTSASGSVSGGSLRTHSGRLFMPGPSPRTVTS